MFRGRTLWFKGAHSDDRQCLFGGNRGLAAFLRGIWPADGKLGTSWLTVPTGQPIEDGSHAGFSIRFVVLRRSACRRSGILKPNAAS